MPDLTLEHGCLVAAALRMPTAVRFVEPLFALLDDPRGAFLHRLDVLPYGGAQALAHAVWQAASGARAPAVRRLTLGIDDPPGPLDVSGWSNLASVVVSGSGLADLDLSLPASALSLRLPFQRDRVLPPLLKRLDAPRLTSLQVEWHRALPAADETDASSRWGFREALGAEVPPMVRSLRLRPVSAAMVTALARAPVLHQLTSLRLDSLFADGVRRVLADPSPVAHLQRLELSVLGMARADRESLRRALHQALPRAELKGATYRREGALG